MISPINRGTPYGGGLEYLEGDGAWGYNWTSLSLRDINTET
jgi:hypothetical protein